MQRFASVKAESGSRSSSSSSSMDGDSGVRANPVVANLADAPEFKSIFTASLQKLIDLFEVNDYELRIAGGAVR